MCPQGAVHVPFRGAPKVCKRLQIDYAEAVVDFEFGHRMAVPVIQGVVIAEEYHDLVMQELEKDEAERRRKEDEKRRKVALGKWRKFLMGMRIAQKIREEYGEMDASISVFAHSKGGFPASEPPKPVETHNEDMAGGFLPEGYEGEDDGDEEQGQQTSAYFPTAAEDGDDDDDGGLVMEDHSKPTSKPESEPELSEPPDESMEDQLEDSEEERARNPVRRTRVGRGGGRGTARKKAAPARRSARARKQVVAEVEDESEGEESWEGDSQDD